MPPLNLYIRRVNRRWRRFVRKFTRRPYCPGRSKELCFTTLSLAMETMGMRLIVVKQSFFGPPEQYGCLVTRVNWDIFEIIHFLFTFFAKIDVLSENDITTLQLWTSVKYYLRHSLCTHRRWLLTFNLNFKHTFAQHSRLWNLRYCIFVLEVQWLDNLVIIWG